MESNNLIFYALQCVSAMLFAVGGFVMKGIFHRLDSYGKRINRLEVDLATNTKENETLIKRLDSIELKIDKILDSWRKSG